MTTSISKASILENIWKNFYDRIKDQVTSTTITGSTTVTVQTYASSFPDKAIDTKSNYPILVVDSPSFSTEAFTMGKTQANGTINVEIYTAQAESADKLASDIFNAVETYKGDLAGVGIHNIEVQSIDQDSVQRQAIKVHLRRFVFSFVYRYDKTKAF